MRDRLHKFLALLLSVMMLFSSLPVTALADIVKDASESGQFFSIAISPDATGYLTYIFKNDNGKELSRQIIKDGDTLYEPEAETRDGYKFVGWYESGAANPFTSFGAQSVAKGTTNHDVILTAKYAPVRYVFFMDASQGTSGIKVFQTLEGTAGSTVNTTEVRLPVAATQTVTGWKGEDGETYNGAYTIPNHDSYLYPVIVEGNWITFITPDDASYVEPEFVKAGATSVAPSKTPVRPGYTFAGWFDEKTGKYNFNELLDNPLELTAHWTPAKVNYTVNYWKENADYGNTNLPAAQRPKEQYSFVGSVLQQGTTGGSTNVGKNLPSSLSSAFASDEANIAGFTAAEVKQVTSLAADGSSVVNVYFNRNTYKIQFWGEGGGNISDGSKGGQGKYLISAKYGAYIANKWPTNPIENGTNGTLGTSTAWNVYKNHSPSWTYITGMQTMPLGDSNYYQRPTRKFITSVSYFKENLKGNTSGTKVSGKYYTLDHEERGAASDSPEVTEEELKQPYVGFKLNTSVSSKVGDSLVGAEFYLDRLSYTITYNYNVDGIPVTTGMYQYEAPINEAGNVRPDAAHTKKTIEGGVCTFVGWYVDAACTELMNFNTTMPAYNFIVYAKWEEPIVDAQAHCSRLTGTHEHDHIFSNIPYGKSIAETYPNYASLLPTMAQILEEEGLDPSKADDYTLYGWRTADGQPFNFDTKLFEHVDIYPVYALTGPYKIAYDLNGGSGTPPTDDNQYRGGSSADIAATSATKQGNVFLGWSLTSSGPAAYQPGDKLPIDATTTTYAKEVGGQRVITLYAIWGPVPTDTTLTYHSNYPAAVLESMGGEQQEQYEGVSPNNTLVKLKNNMFDVPTGYTFLGWTTKEGGSVVEFAAGEDARIDNNGENHLYAVWQRDTGTLVIVKRVEDEYGTFEGDTFTFTVNGPDDYAGAPQVSREVNSIDTNVVISTQTVETGIYTVTEPAMERYYTENPSQTVTVGKGDPVTVIFVNEFKAGHLTVVKTADRKTDLNLDDVVTYTITVTNDGNVDLHDVTVTDEMTGLTNASVNPSTLAPGVSGTITTKHTITEEDILEGTFVNTAVATGKDPKENPVTGQDDETVTPVEPNPGIDVVKTADKTTGLKLGDIVTYTITVTNIGNVTLENVTVTDAKIIGATWTVASLAPKASQSWTVNYTITQADVDAGQVYNVATAKGEAPDGTTVEDEDNVTVTTEQTPGITLDKTATIIHNGSKWCTAEDADETKAHLGDVIQYTFTVKNTGNVTLHDVKITDDKLGKTFTIEGTLAPDATATYTGEDTKYTVTEDDIQASKVTNTATATGTAPNDVKVTDEDTETVPTDEPTPEMTSEKTLTNSGTGADGKFKAGETATFDIVVTNSGNVTLHNVTVTEEKTPGATIVEGTGYTIENGKAVIGDMAPGDTVTVKATYKVTQADIDSDEVLKNIATADSEETEPQYPDEPIPEEDKNPAMTSEKTLTNLINATGEIKDENGNVIGKGFKAGEIAEFDIVVTNSGNVTLHGVFVTEELTPGATIVEGEGYTVVDGVAVIGTMAPGATVTVKATYEVTQADIDSNAELKNIATADSDETEPQDPDEPIPEEDKNPVMTTVKTLTNSGKGVDKDGNPNGKFTAGETAKFDITVTNIGNVTLHHVTVTEEKTPGATIVAGEGYDVVDGKAVIGTMAPGATVTVKAEYTVSQADVDAGKQLKNIATVTSDETDPEEPEVPFDPEDRNPALEVEKTATKLNGEDYTAGTKVKAGDVITYRITVTNTGNVTLHEIRVEDTRIKSYWTVDTLAPGESHIHDVYYTVTQADIDDPSGSILNVAKATAPDPTDPENPPVEDEDEEKVPTEQDPKLEIVKTFTEVTHQDGCRHRDNELAHIGDTLNYTITVTNSGNMTLTNVEVEDKTTLPDVEIVAGEGYDVIDGKAVIATMAPDAVVTVNAAYVVKDTDAGKTLHNVATATAPDPRDPDDPDITVNDDENVEIPKIEAVKTLTNSGSGENGAFKAGETAEFGITVTNTGNTTQTNVTVSEMDGATIVAGDGYEIVDGEAVIESMAPGAVVVVKAIYTVTQVDIDDGVQLENIATLDGDNPDEPVPVPVPEDEKHPGVKAVKKLINSGTGEDGKFKADDVALFTVTVENTGNTTQKKVTVDEALANATFLPFHDADFTAMNTNSGIDRNEMTVTVSETGVVIENMPPQVKVTLHAQYTVTQEDIDDNKELQNIVTLTGDNPDEPGPEPVPEDLRVGLEVIKTAVEIREIEIPDRKDGTAVGDTIVYTIAVTNTGTMTLTAVQVDDILAGVKFVEGTGYTVNADGTATIATLAPDETVTLTAEYAVTQKDIDAGSVYNKATATADDPRTDHPDEKVTDDDDETVVLDKKPAMATEKTLTNEGTGTDAEGNPNGSFKAGETAEFDITVKNTGNVTLTNVTVTEMAGAYVLLNVNEPTAYRVQNGVAIIPAIAPGDTVTVKAAYTVTQADIDDGEELVNIATVKPEEIPDPEEPDEPVPEDEPKPAMATEKTLTNEGTGTDAEGNPNGSFKAGETAEFDITVTNTGNVTLTNVTVKEMDGAAIVANGDAYDIEDGAAVIAAIAPGETVTVKAAYTVTQADIDDGEELVNIATVKPEEIPDPDEPDEPIPEDEYKGHLTVTKVTTSVPANGEGYALGETITYSLTVTNDGNLTIEDVVLLDELTGLTYEIGTLAPGETSEAVTTEYVVTEVDVLAGSVLNVATATGTSPDPDEPEVPVDPGESEDPTDPKEGHLTVTKVTTSVPANGEGYALGETITYSLTVTNDGNLTIEDVVLVDELTGLTYEIGTLAPGETSEEVTTEYVVTEADVLAGSVLNVATATGTSPDPEEPEVPVDPGESEDPTDPKEGHLTVTKVTTSVPANGEGYALGETITYSLTVTNDGNLTIEDVVLLDELTGLTYEIGTLAPGETSEAVTTEYVVTEADVLAGSVLNVATATGTSPDPEEPEVPVDPGETEDPTDDPNPVFTLLKTVTNLPETGVYNEGETILYNIRVENTGNVTLRNMVITDVLAGIVIEAGEGYVVEGNLITIAVLEPGQAVDVAASYTVTNADLSGQVTNTVTATADGPDEENPDENKPEDQTSTVTVPTAERTYTLTVHYRYLDGTEAFADYVQGDMLAGTEYNVVSPTLAGYTVNPEVVTGIMPPMNWEVTVFYVPIPVPPAPTGPNPVIIDEYGVPLNIGNVVMNVGDCFE